MRSVLFVCTANICRSPMAEGVLRAMLRHNGAAGKIEVSSAGTHDLRVGSPPYALAVQAARNRGYELSNSGARCVKPSDFDAFDHILVMDRHNLAHLRSICPTRCKSKIEMLLEYGDEHHGKDVPDPYGGEPKDFERALDMIEDGCRGLALVLSRAA